jgi:hypothetical protein
VRTTALIAPCAKASTLFCGRHDDPTRRRSGREAMGSSLRWVPRGGLDFHREGSHVLGPSASAGLTERSDADDRHGDDSEAKRGFWAGPYPVE